MPTPLRCEPLEPRDTPATLPTGFAEDVIASGITGATAMAIAPNGDVWVTEQTGTVKRFRPGSTAADVVTSVTVDSGGERGLLGIAFDPDYATNKLLYLYHTVPGTSSAAPFNRVSRVVVNDANAADYTAGTPSAILSLDPLSSATNHNGGAIHFGGDGKLYVAVGENANAANAQSLSNRLGKILRINPDGSIPADNPTTFDGVSGTTAGLNRSIWAIGLRNPFTFAVQPGTGRLFINDVGGALFEEVNDGRAGANYGWPTTEGPSPGGVAGVTYPVYAYNHGSGPLQGRTIAGGAFYSPDTVQFPSAFVGDYFFADFVVSRIYVRDVATGSVTTFAEGASNPVDLKLTGDGRLLYLSRGAGTVSAVRSTVTGSGPVAAVSTGAGTPLRVVVRNADGSTRFTLAPFGDFGGGATAAVGDVTGDGTKDIVVAAGPGGGPHVKIFDGITGAEVRSFFAFAPVFAGGLNVAIGDVDATAGNEIVVGAGAGGGPNVRVFTATGGELRSFFAYNPAYRGGVNVATGDVDGDGRDDVITGTGAGGAPHVRAVRMSDLAELRSFFAFDVGFTGGVYVTAGDINRDGTDEIITGAGAGGGPNVKVFLLTPDISFFAYDPAFRGGVRVGYEDGFLYTGPGPGGGPHVKVFDVGDATPRDQFFPFDIAFRGGVFVG